MRVLSRLNWFVLEKKIEWKLLTSINISGASRRGSSSESSPAGTVGGTSIMGGSDGGGIMSSDGGGYLECTSHYDRMPLPIPIVPPPPPNMLSEDEIEPAYATGEYCQTPWLTLF